MMEKKKVLKQQQQLPEEMVEEILVNLPVKSLLRFSSVSKSWNSMIFESSFVKRYRRRRREKNIVLRRAIRGHKPIHVRCGGPTFPVSSISSSEELRATEFVDCPFGEGEPRHLASCEELWLATDSQFESLYLWNPSMRRYKKLHHPSVPPSRDILSNLSYAYGLGYDSLGNDYKILKIPMLITPTERHCCAELYSLRSDSWRKIPNCPTVAYFTSMLQSVSGNLHWMSSCTSVIHCFDLSTEKFGEVAQHAYYHSNSTWVSPIVLNGMLGVAVPCADKCDVWVMEDYGVTTSWTKWFSISGFFLNPYLRPLYFYQNGDILVQGKCMTTDRGDLFVCRDDHKTTPKLVSYISSGRHFNVKGGEIYVDSLVAPAMWSSTSTS